MLHPSTAKTFLVKNRLKLKLRNSLVVLGLSVLGNTLAGCQMLSSLNPFGGGGDVAPTPTAPPAQAPASAPIAVNSQTPFRDAVNKAMSAANAVQTAKTPEEWQQVVMLWQEAIALLKIVPASDPRYAEVQPKIQEYQQNLEYAQKNAGPQGNGSPSPSPSPTASP